eukprot:TRINITY_DN7812_c0_g1_i1.p1 TRINITY_DN7812_c0_g1~~TRINITY_DN7812_c0_g1_i1.p1  ORF type:complete len:427 (+),score=85.17 TRINITY_DN7812_c0_g1_i1:95-1282(+)
MNNSHPDQNASESLGSQDSDSESYDIDVGDIEVLPFHPDLLGIYSEAGVEWMTSHVQPDKIIWTSHPRLLKPNIDMDLFKHNDVVNTWFVDSAQPSIEGSQVNWIPQIEKASEIIAKSNAILIVAGAGIGVDSGLPDYRGPSGFWRAYPNLKKTGLSLEEMSHPDWFEENPCAAWGFYAHRCNLYHSADPHQGFFILKEWATKTPSFIFTSNIDSQFQKAGFAEDVIYEAHGSLGYLQCTDEDCKIVWKQDVNLDINEDLVVVDKNMLPKCPQCGNLARPNVSMFGDNNFTWQHSRAKGQKEKFLTWISNICGPLSEEPTSDKPVLTIVEIGCGTTIHSLRTEVELLCTRSDIDLIRINPGDFQVTSKSHVSIGMGSLASLVSINEKLGQVNNSM